MMPATMATLGFLKIKLFLKEGYDATSSVHDILTKFYYVAQITLQMRSYNQNLVILAFL